MGTPMAVNFANLFMGKFEKEMLSAFETEHNMKPALWLRFIDDVFIVWEGHAKDLSLFMQFAN